MPSGAAAADFQAHAYEHSQAPCTLTVLIAWRWRTACRREAGGPIAKLKREKMISTSRLPRLVTSSFLGDLARASATQIASMPSGKFKKSDSRVS